MDTITPTTLTTTEPIESFNAIDALASQQWDTHLEAEKSLFTACERDGFAAARQRSENRDPFTHEYTRFIYTCYKGGSSRPSKAGQSGRPLRVLSTPKTGCKWECALSRLRGGGVWRFSYVAKRSTHNHELSDNASNITLNRRRALYQPQVLEAIAANSVNKRNSTADIVDMLKQQYPHLEAHTHDISNIIAKQRKERFGDLTATQRFLESLATTEGVWHRIRRAPDNRITSILWTYQWCIQQWQRNPEILSVDNTYKVNKFNMPLCQLHGITNLHSTFPIAYCLVSDEKEESFEWILHQLRVCAQANGGIEDPYVIISDFDKAFKRAARAVYPDTVKHQICVWHILKNVAHNTKKKWIGSLDGTLLGNQGGGMGSGLREDEAEKNEDEAISSKLATQQLEAGDQDFDIATGPNQPPHLVAQQSGWVTSSEDRRFLPTADGILYAWRCCVYSKTEAEFQETWKRIEAEFPEQQPIISYLRATYLPVCHEFATYAISLHRNFGLKATSRSEGSHATLKRYLINRLADLSDLHEAIQTVFQRLQQKYNNVLQKQRDEKRVNLIDIPLFRNLHYHVSFFGLTMVFEQYKLANQTLRGQTPNTGCLGTFSTQFGLPCRHTIYNLLLENEPLQLYHHIHSHWWLRREDPLSEAELTRRLEQDPRILPSRQRNRNGPLPVGEYAQSREAHEARDTRFDSFAEDEVIPATQLPSRRDTSVRRDPSHDEEPRQRRGGSRAGLQTSYRATPYPSTAPARSTAPASRGRNTLQYPGQGVWQL